MAGLDAIETASRDEIAALQRERLGSTGDETDLAGC